MAQKKNITKKKAESILNSCVKAYDKDGVQGAITMAEKRGIKDYGYCGGCEAEQPIIKHNMTVQGQPVTVETCCVCSQNLHSNLHS